MKLYKIMAFLAAASFAFLMVGCDIDTETPETPEPVATETPEPVATETPEPVATETPEPAATQPQQPVTEFEAAETPEELFQQLITLMNDISGQLESVTDHASADAAAMALDNRFTPRIKAVGERVREFVGEIGWDALDEAAEKFDDQGDAAAERLFTQMERLETEEALRSPNLVAALERFEETLESFDDID